MEGKVRFPLTAPGEAVWGLWCCWNCHECPPRKCALSCAGHGHSAGWGLWPPQGLFCASTTRLWCQVMDSQLMASVTDNAWDSAQGEIYAWILLQCVIWLLWLQHVTELKWMMKLCTVIFISRSQLQSASRCMFNAFLFYYGVYLMYVVLTKWLKTLQCVQKYIVLNFFPKCQCW